MSESRSFVTSDGGVLVDTKVACWGQPLIDRIDTFVADVREAKQAGQSAAECGGELAGAGGVLRLRQSGSRAAAGVRAGDLRRAGVTP